MAEPGVTDGGDCSLFHLRPEEDCVRETVGCVVSGAGGPGAQSGEAEMHRYTHAQGGCPQPSLHRAAVLHAGG